MNVEHIIDMARQVGASDVHLVCGLPVKFRLAGRLENAGVDGDAPLSHDDCEQLARRLAGDDFDRIQRIGELDRAETIGGVRVRINLFRQQGHVSAALRLLSDRIPALETLGLPPAVMDFPRIQRGIVVVTGETGSGKSTTLAALIDSINHTRAENIITMEDPIEYVYTPDQSVISQREIGQDTESYSNALRAVLREAPDVRADDGDACHPQPHPRGQDAADSRLAGHVGLGGQRDHGQRADRPGPQPRHHVPNRHRCRARCRLREKERSLMPTFTYTGITAAGQQIDGVVEAFDEIEAMERAREQCRVVQSVVPVREGKNLLSMDITKPKAKQKNLAVMCAQFATILNAGVPAARATSLVADQVTDKCLKRVLADVAADVASGHSLAESFQSKGENLPRVFIETVRAGEESGHLPESFQRLHGYFDKRAKVSAKVQSAMTYPIFVAVIAVVVLAIMMVMVIPSMTGMIASLGADTPAMTQFLIDASNFVTDNFLLIAVVLALIVVGVKLFGTTERGKTTFAVLKLRLPVLGAVGVCSGAAQFANTMAMLVTAGLPATRAVAITSRVMSNYVLSREVGRLEAGLEEGRTLGEGLEASTYLPRTLVEMVAVGEHTGELEETLETMGAFYDDETQRVTNKAISIMEPALLVLMALFAGFIVIALYLPMFSLYAAM